MRRNYGDVQCRDCGALYLSYHSTQCLRPDEFAHVSSPEPILRYVSKPRLKWSDLDGRWMCIHNAVGRLGVVVIGYGMTPTAAYTNWLSRCEAYS